MPSNIPEIIFSWEVPSPIGLSTNSAFIRAEFEGSLLKITRFTIGGTLQGIGSIWYTSDLANDHLSTWQAHKQHTVSNAGSEAERPIIELALDTARWWMSRTVEIQPTWLQNVHLPEYRDFRFASTLGDQTSLIAWLTTNGYRTSPLTTGEVGQRQANIRRDARGRFAPRVQNTTGVERLTQPPTTLNPEDPSPLECHTCDITADQTTETILPYVVWPEFMYAGTTETRYLCEECYDEAYSRCQNCDHLLANDHLMWTLNRGLWCYSCRDERIVYCERGDHEYDLNNLGVGECGDDCSDHCDCDTDVEADYEPPDPWAPTLFPRNHPTDCGCGECQRAGNVQRFDYDPRHFNFFPLIEGDPYHPDPKELYIGLELEVSFGPPSGQAIRKWLPEQLYPANKTEDGYAFWYAKSDGSVENGFEIVSMPFQPKWGLENLDLEPFAVLLKDYGARKTHESAGTHIHMAKHAFSSNHLWKFMQLHQKQAPFCGLIGGRGTASSYGSFDRNGWRDFAPNIMEFAKTKSKGFRWHERYMAINVQNVETIELRYPASNIEPEGIRKNIQWALALFNYSKYINMDDIKGGALNTPGNLIWFIQQEPELYKDLLDFIEIKIPRAKPLKERS